MRLNWRGLLRVFGKQNWTGQTGVVNLFARPKRTRSTRRGLSQRLLFTCRCLFENGVRKGLEGAGRYFVEQRRE
jgi:hypothetical protein